MPCSYFELYSFKFLLGRDWPIAVVRRPVRQRHVVGGIEHRGVDAADLAAIEVEPFGECVAALGTTGRPDDPPRGEHDAGLFVHERVPTRGDELDGDGLEARRAVGGERRTTGPA